MDLSQNFSEKLNSLLADKIPAKLAVAVSGGSDSMALSFLAIDFCQKNNIELFLITIDHKVRDGSTFEAQEIQKIFKKLNLNHQLLTISAKNIPTSNIEANLRQQRYELLYQFCEKNNINELLLGHHLGDIAENFLIRLFRGSGLDGLSPISEICQYKEINLIRPLLDFSKSQLKEYLEIKNIKYFDDPTNNDEKFLRNKIRNFLESLTDQEDIQARIKKTSEDIYEMKVFYDEILVKEARNIVSLNNQNYQINKPKLRKINNNIALKIIALILMETGQKQYKPRLNKLKNFYKHITQDAKIKKRNFYGCIIEELDNDNLIFLQEVNSKVKRQEIYNQLKIRDLLN